MTRNAPLLPLYEAILLLNFYPALTVHGILVTAQQIQKATGMFPRNKYKHENIEKHLKQSKRILKNMMNIHKPVKRLS